ncbi:hypothetical protein [Actinomadura sp. 6N118]|uniref:hypothetical protein n=1 Tax=Actinomadura sp. 6N118 TaxID=3375151 RepID=UPI0037A4C42A
MTWIIGGTLATVGLIAIAGWLAARSRQLLNRSRASASAQPGDQARQIMIVPPPETPLSGAVTWWTHLTGIAAPTKSHVSFEYLWTAAGAQISVWVPPSLPLESVAQAAQAAWPGAATIIGPPGELLPGAAEVTGGVLRLAGPEVLPLEFDHPADPLRALFAAAAAQCDGERAVVQILARPATASAWASNYAATPPSTSTRPSTTSG